MSEADEGKARVTVMSESLLKYVGGQYDVAIIQTLTLSHMGIRVIDGLSSCALLTSLDISHNSITALPADSLAESLGGTLRNFDISHNLLSHVEGIHHLKSIEILRLDYNKIEEFPIITLPKLRRLYVQGNPFVTSGGPNYRDRFMVASKSLHAVDGEYFAEVGQCIRKEQARAVEAGEDDVVLPQSRPWLSDGFFDKVLTDPATLQRKILRSL